MKSEQKLEHLQRRLQQDRAAMSERAAAWAVPFTALVAGALVPVVTRSASANPIMQLLVFVRQTITRFFRFMVYRNVLAALHRSGVIDADAAEPF